MGWLHKLLRGEPEAESGPAQPIANPQHLVPPPLPHLPNQDPAAAHKRGYASNVCPSCGVRLKPVPHKTTTCDSCGEPVVVKSGEDGQWHLLREADLMAFLAQQEEIRGENYKSEDEALLEAGFLVGDVQVDVVEESRYQEALASLAGDLSKTGAIEPVVALLTREPDHPHDKNAIRVDVGDATVGYIEKWDAKKIQPLMKRLEQAGRPAWVRAWVVGGWEDDHSHDNYRLRLDSLPELD